jgi:putative tricarboxylic transport membrane protein
MWLGVLLAVVAAFELVVALKVPALKPSPAADGDPLAEDVLVNRPAAILAVLSVIAALLVPLLGFVLATAVFVAAAAWTLAPDRRVANALTAVAIPLGVWIVFVAWLGVPLPRGPLGF